MQLGFRAYPSSIGIYIYFLTFNYSCDKDLPFCYRWFNLLVNHTYANWRRATRYESKKQYSPSPLIPSP